MKKCECGAEIEDKYEQCFNCMKKKRQEESSKSQSEIVTELGKLNNNLYYLRRAWGIILRDGHKKELKWEEVSSGKSDFVEKELE